jgi:hypothetical protein
MEPAQGAAVMATTGTRVSRPVGVQEGAGRHDGIPNFRAADGLGGGAAEGVLAAAGELDGDGVLGDGVGVGAAESGVFSPDRGAGILG